MKRRQFIKLLGSSLLAYQCPSTAFYGNKVQNKTNNKFIWIILRGAQDGLHTIIPRQEQHRLNQYRPRLSSAIKSAALPLNAAFSLHPSLKYTHQLYQQGECSPVVAVGSGYEQRSHFDGQDFLESGSGRVTQTEGWLARAVDIKQATALALNRSTPISLRSDKVVTSTWYPSDQQSDDSKLFDALFDLYEKDPILSKRLSEGLAVSQMSQGVDLSKSAKATELKLAKACAQLLSGDKGYDTAMLEISGWDTHNDQINRLNYRLNVLDKCIKLIKEGLKDDWQNTVVAIATEFGRTVKENGTKGTDHGNASAMFFLGGAINGGEVLGQWPGLEPNQLFENRDLLPTTNTFSWLASALEQHWGFTETQINVVFPNVKGYAHKLIK